MKIYNNIVLKIDDEDIEDGVLEIPNGVVRIENNAFRDNIELEQLVFPQTLKEIGQSAFSGCEELRVVEGGIVDKIDDYAFSNCINLSEIDVSNVREFGNEVFRDCQELTSLQLKAEKCGAGLFRNCDNLIDVSLLGDDVIISEEMFAGCRSLMSVSIFNNIAKIEDNAFNGCNSLRMLEINKNTQFSDFALSDCAINNVVIKEFNEDISLENNLTNIKVSDSGIEFKAGDNAQERVYFDFKNGKYVFNLDDLKEKIKDIDKAFKLKGTEEIVHWIELIKDVQDIPRENVRLPQSEAIMLLKNDDERIEFIKNLGKYNKLSGKYRSLNLADREQILKLCKLLGAFEDDEKQFVQASNVLSKDLPNFIEKMNGVKVSDFDDSSFLITDWFKNIKYPLEFNKKCADFFMDNYKNLLEQNKVDLLAMSINDFDSLSKSANHIDINKIEEILMKELPADTKQSRRELAKIMIMQGAFNKESFETLDGIMTKAEGVYPNIFESAEKVLGEINTVEREKATHLVDELDENIQYEWLDKDSPYNLLIGNICGCCARLGREGQDIMVKSATHSSVQTMALKKRDGEYMGKATVYLNREKGYAVFNNLELNRNYATRAKSEDFDDVMNAFMRGAKSFVEVYNKENPDNELKIVTIGADKNKIIGQIRARLPKSAKNYPSIEFEGYKKGGDSGSEQFVVYRSKD